MKISNLIISPFFFEQPIVTGNIFLGMMENTTLCHVPVESFPVSIPPHLFLDRMFPVCWIGREGPIPWPIFLKI
jgi:hypothetical protein